jgi:hypothetical protein
VATYLDLVNEALRESGSTLDQLTSATFPSPSDPLYTKFKQWSAQSWEDIQTDRRDWEFMQGTAVVRLSPAMEIHGGDAPVLATGFDGSEFRLHNAANAHLFTAAASSAFTLSDGAIADNDLEGLLKIADFETTDFIIEPGDLITNSAGTVHGRFTRWGRYDLSQTGAAGYDSVLDIAEIKTDSVAICDLQTASGQSYDSSTYIKLQFVPYSKWLAYGYDRPKRVGTPIKFTVSNDGKLEFYPPLDTAYNLYFEYTKTPQTLSTYSDTPTGLPARFHKAISWRALMYYGEYDGISRIYNIAKNRYSKFEYEMVRDLLPEVTIGYDARRF